MVASDGLVVAVAHAVIVVVDSELIRVVLDVGAQFEVRAAVVVDGLTVGAVDAVGQQVELAFIVYNIGVILGAAAAPGGEVDADGDILGGHGEGIDTAGFSDGDIPVVGIFHGVAVKGITIGQGVFDLDDAARHAVEGRAGAVVIGHGNIAVDGQSAKRGGGAAEGDTSAEGDLVGEAAVGYSGSVVFADGAVGVGYGVAGAVLAVLALDLGVGKVTIIDGAEVVVAHDGSDIFFASDAGAEVEALADGACVVACDATDVI